MAGSATVESPEFTCLPTEDPMTEENMAWLSSGKSAGLGDLLIERGGETVPQILMETDVDGVIGAGWHERSASLYRPHCSHRPTR